MLRNVASQKWRVYAWDATTGLAKTGDAANISARITKDYGSSAATNDTNPTEVSNTLEKGMYEFDLTQAETDAFIVMLAPQSSTSNIVVMGMPPVACPVPQYNSVMAVTSAGGVTLGDAVSHGGTLGSSTATLALSRLSVVSQSSNTAGVTITGNGSGEGVLMTGGTTGNGFTITAGASGGTGLRVTSNSSNTNAVFFSAASGGAALNLAAGAAASGLLITGGAASGATPAGHGIKVTGGAASTTGGGVAGNAILSTGGAGAASTNGAAAGVVFVGGGTNTVASSADGFQVTGTSNGSGIALVSAGTGSGILTDKITASGAVAFQSTFAVTTSTSLAALSATTVTFSGAVAFQSTFAVTTSTSLAALSATTVTFSGAVAFQSTFAVTTSTSLAALSCTTLTASGAVALQSTLTVTGAVLFSSTFATTGTTTFNAFTVTNAMTVSGTTTLTGAVSLGSTLGVTGTTTLAAVSTGAIGTGNVTITGTLSTSGTTTLNALTVTAATTLTGNVSMAAGLNITQTTSNTAALVVTGNGSGNGATFTGGAAVTSTAAGHGIVFVGGASSATSGGTAGIGVKGLGGAGAASNNGAGDGTLFIGGGTTTVAGGNGMTLTHTGSGKDFNATTTPLVLAKTTNITGFNDITAAAASTAVWSEAIPGSFIAGQAGYVLGNIATGTPPTAAAIATAVWQDTTAGDFTTSGSPGFMITGIGTSGVKYTTTALTNAGGGGGDPWLTALPGAYTPGQAGYILGTNLDATITSRSTLTQTQVTGGAYSIQSASCVLGDARIGNLDASVNSRLPTSSYVSPVGAAVVITDTTTLNSIADTGLKRDWTVVTGEASRSTLNALRKLRNKVDTTSFAGDLAVFKEDDTTPAYLQVIVTSASAELITSAG